MNTIAAVFHAAPARTEALKRLAPALCVALWVGSFAIATVFMAASAVLRFLP